jgi:hypothetical protein
MSQLMITGLTTSWTMNVIAFSSPVNAQINSAQTRTLAVHFPIKMAQPDLQLDVQFFSQNDFQNFQLFVRNHQQQLSSNPAALITLFWPDKSMLNYTGYIPKFEAGAARANYAPRARFSISLVNSFITAQTDLASVAANWQAIFGGIGLPNGVLSAANLIAQPTQELMSVATTIDQTVGILTGSG